MMLSRIYKKSLLRLIKTIEKKAKNWLTSTKDCLNKKEERRKLALLREYKDVFDWSYE